MATINYATLKFPDILFNHIRLLQACPAFNVYKYTHKPGIIFRIPHGVKTDDVCHFFFEHEINLTNTLKTGTLTLKVQITLVPCHMGVFSGFAKLPGSYQTDWQDEDYGYDTFIPDYDRGIKRIVPLPVGGTTNLYEYLNEILFNQVQDVDIISKYAVDLGCQKEYLKNKVEFSPAPQFTSETSPEKSKLAFNETLQLFDFLSNSEMKLIPENN